MRLFDFLRRKPRVILTDDLFGPLEYFTFKDASKNYYEGTITFDAQPCSISFDADENGPTTAQKEFFRELADRYPQLKNEVLLPFLHRELEDWTSKEPLTDFDKAFEMDGISFYRIEGGPISWSLTLYWLNIDHWVTIEFNDWTPEEGVAIDG